VKKWHTQRFLTAIILCRWHIIISSPPGTNIPFRYEFCAVVQCSAKIIPHWGTIFTSTPAEPMFAANFCPTGTEVDCSALPRHWRGSRYLPPVEADYHFGPTGFKVGSIAEILSYRDIISGLIARSSKWCPAGTPFSAHLILTLKCLLRRNFCATGTQVKMRPQWVRINESPSAPYFPQRKNSIQGFLTAGS